MWQCLEQPFMKSTVYLASLLPICFLFFFLLFEHMTNRSSLYVKNVIYLLFLLFFLGSTSLTNLALLARDSWFVEPITHNNIGYCIYNSMYINNIT